MNRLLVIGFGDIAHRTAARLPASVEVRAVSRSTGFDLDLPDTLAPLVDSAGWADTVLHCAPPPSEGTTDPRIASLLAVLEAGRILPSRIVYISTSGVYGDCGGAWVDETRPVNPQTARAVRRVDAETQLLTWGTPVLTDRDDVYTNHIHADDLALIALEALQPGAPAGIYNASDDTRMKMGEWFDLVADRLGLARPPRVSRAEAAKRIPAASLSFMSESRRLSNRKIKEVLGVTLAYPTVFEGVPEKRLAA
jgi:nucleoside-diphosphate-sugar epimerase